MKNKQTLKTQTIIYPIVLSSLLAMLSACTPYVEPPRSALATATAVETSGHVAAMGAAIGTAGAATGAGAGAGALAGAAYGSYLVSSYRMVEILQRQGVQVIQLGKKLEIIIPADVLFQPGSDVLETKAYSLLDDVREFLKRYGDVSYTVYGFSDNVYAPDQAFQLTTRQARRVAAYFWGTGKPFYQVASVGMGSRYPIASNGNPAGSAKNRRIVVMVPVVQNRIFSSISKDLDLQ